jgi:hypothetical protein
MDHKSTDRASSHTAECCEGRGTAGAPVTYSFPARADATRGSRIRSGDGSGRDAGRNAGIRLDPDAYSDGTFVEGGGKHSDSSRADFSTGRFHLFNPQCDYS